MTSIIDRMVARLDDLAAKRWIAAALIDAFPDPAVEGELTHVRAVLAPVAEQLLADSRMRTGSRLDMSGRIDDEPMLALAESAVRTRFGRTRPGSALREIFRLLIELVCYDPSFATSRHLANVARALRLEFEALIKKPARRAEVPAFQTSFEAIEWFGRQDRRYTDDARGSWNRQLAPLLRLALQNPVPPPGDVWELDDPGVADGFEIELQTKRTGIGAEEGEAPDAPVRYWLLPADDASEAPRRSTIPEAVVVFSISTAIPLSRFTTASTTFLFDVEIEAEVRRLLGEADRWLCADDRIRAAEVLGLAFTAATATPRHAIPAVRWEAVSTHSPRPFPGTLSHDARWLYRQALNPSSDSAAACDAVVAIPVPPALATRILLMAGAAVPGQPVFASSEGLAAATQTRPSGGIDATTLRRALLGRLVRDPTYGATLAQHVAADDLGVDIAPLFYDQIRASEIAVRVAQCTFRWFGDDSRRLGTSLPEGLVGSRRVPEIRHVQSFMRAIHADFQGALGDPVLELRQRMRNCVHGLALFSGHRPNDNFSRLRAWSFSRQDPIGIVADKITGADWQVRPVAVPASWAAEFSSLLAALQKIRLDAPDTALGRAAARALEGSGPVFLDVRSTEDVEPFGALAYREGCPAELLGLDNFARQLLNNHLTQSLREPLRVAQLGWHGTREGAWAEGSPWSVLSAARKIAPIVQGFLKAAGWKALPPVRAQPAKSAGVDWIAAEANHAQVFRERVRAAKSAEAERDRAAVERMQPRLSEILAHYPGLVLKDGGRLERADTSRTEPIAFSPEDQDRVLRYLAGADARSREARAARNHLHDLIKDARERGVVAGPLPRRVFTQWPVEPGCFIPEAAVALEHARVLDALIAKGGDGGQAARTAVALLLHGGYADVSSVLRVMQRGTRLGRLASRPDLLLAEHVPARNPPEPDDDDDGAGCFVFHGVAALHLVSWHEWVAGGSVAVPTVESLDGELRCLASSCSDEALAGFLAKRGLAGVAALARTCNAIRMDGWARPVGTGKVKLTTLSVERIAAIRDSHLVSARRWRPEWATRRWIATRGGESEHRAHMLADQLSAALGEAVRSVDGNNRGEEKIRARLAKKIHGWLDRARSPRPEELVALFVLTLLERGGRRKEKLQLTTIQGYMQAVAGSVCDHFPDAPLEADAGEWEAAYLRILAAEPIEHRRTRLEGLLNFHWVLGQALEIPEVGFSSAYAFAGASCDRVDAGYLSDAELSAFFAMVERDASSPACASAEDIHRLKLRHLGADLVAGAALRPGEVNRLVFNDVSSAGRRWNADIRKTHVQRLKTANARRRARIEWRDGRDGETFRQALDNARERMRGTFSGATRVFHRLDDPVERLNDGELFDGLGAVLRWITGRPETRLYWLRKTEIRRRLEVLMGEATDSLWPTRDLLASIGHGSLRVTLRSYTHDPVTPFLRWLSEDSWCEISADRLAVAADRSLSVIRRRRGGHALSARPGAITARVATLLERVDLIQPVYGGSVELPPVEVHADGSTRPLAVLSRVLESIARGRTPAGAASAHRWPVLATRPLENALARLRMDFGVALGTGSGDAGVVVVGPPRWVTPGGPIEAVLKEPAALPVLQSMGDAWLAGMQHACIEGIPATPQQWETWEQALPALSAVAWDISGRGRRLELYYPKASRKGAVSPWPVLRWLLLVAWCHRQPGVGQS